MKIIKALPLALALSASAIMTAVHAPSVMAQVSNIDAAWAQSAIQQAGYRAGKVPAIKKVPSVGVIRLDVANYPVFMGDVPTWQEFRIMAQNNAAGVRKLQRALMANPATRAALARVHVQAWQVAGVQIGSNGALRLYIFSNRYF